MLHKFYRRVQFPGDVWQLNSELLPDGRRSFNFKSFLDSNYQRSLVIKALVAVVAHATVSKALKRLKLSTFIYRHLQGKRLTIRSGVLTGNDIRWHSASSGSPLPERTDFGPRSLQL